MTTNAWIILDRKLVSCVGWKFHANLILKRKNFVIRMRKSKIENYFTYLKWMRSCWNEKRSFNRWLLSFTVVKRFWATIIGENNETFEKLLKSLLRRKIKRERSLGEWKHIYSCNWDGFRIKSSLESFKFIGYLKYLHTYLEVKNLFVILEIKAFSSSWSFWKPFVFLTFLNVLKYFLNFIGSCLKTIELLEFFFENLKFFNIKKLYEFIKLTKHLMFVWKFLK